MAILLFVANDANGIARVHRKDNVYWCLSIIRTQDTLDNSLKIPLWFVVIESEKSQFECVGYVKVKWHDAVA